MTVTLSLAKRIHFPPTLRPPILHNLPLTDQQSNWMHIRGDVLGHDKTTKLEYLAKPI